MGRDDAHEIEQLLPLPEAVFHILLALAGGERHGYAIMQEVADLTGGQMHIGPGTLYGAIQRMLAGGLIDEVKSRGGVDDRRRTYRTTPFGRRVALAETERLRRLVTRARGAFVPKRT
jgi:DNA-binding PadR family transcriptional regulator